jgi:hypothetical protein
MVLFVMLPGDLSAAQPDLRIWMTGHHLDELRHATGVGYGELVIAVAPLVHLAILILNR